MKDAILKLGFAESADGSLVLKNKRFEVKCYQLRGSWYYNWKSLEENCGADKWVLQNATQLLFYTK